MPRGRRAGRPHHHRARRPRSRAPGARRRRPGRRRRGSPTSCPPAPSSHCSPRGRPAVPAPRASSPARTPPGSRRPAPLAALTGLGAGDRIAATGPLHVSMHLYAALHALWLGATATDSVVGATAVHATPTRLARLLDGPTVPPTAIVAGAASSDALRRRAAARGIRVTEYYGAAELSFVAAGRDGRLDPFPGVEVELRRGAAGRRAVGAVAVPGARRRRRRDAAPRAPTASPRWATWPSAPPTAASAILGRGDAAITTAGATVLAEHVEARLTALPGVDAAAVLGEAARAPRRARPRGGRARRRRRARAGRRGRPRQPCRRSSSPGAGSCTRCRAPTRARSPAACCATRSPTGALGDGYPAAFERSAS